MSARSTGGKPINLMQLQTEIEAAGVMVSPGLGTIDDYVHVYDADGLPADFAEADQAAVDAAIAAHTAMRDKTDQEYATEFQAAGTTLRASRRSATSPPACCRATGTANAERVGRSRKVPGT